MTSALEARLMGFASEPDPGVILDPGALCDATDLLRAAPDLHADTTAIAGVGFLHYLRWLASEDEGELQVSVMLSAPLLWGHRGLMQEPVRLFLIRERKQARKRLRAHKPAEPNPAKDALRAYLTAGPPVRPAAWAGLLWQLSLFLYSRYEQTGEPCVLGEAVAVLRHVITVTPPDDPGYAVRQASLGAWLLVLSDGEPGEDDLRDALRATRPAVAALAGDKRGLAALSVLGSGLEDLFELTGDLDALDVAIRAHRDAMTGASAEESDDGDGALRLAGALLRRFGRTGELSTLDEAIGYLKVARSAVGTDDPNVRAVLANSVSVALRERYDLSGEEGDLDEAIAQARLAVSAAVTASARGAAHGTLGWALLARYLRYASAGRYNVTGTSVRKEATRHLRAAVASFAADDPRRARALSNFGTALLRAHGVKASPKLAARAAAAFEEVADSSVAAPAVRVQAGFVAGHLAADRADWAAAASRLGQAVRDLDLVIPAGRRRPDREHQLGRLRDLACDAAACAWRAGDADLAAVLLEQGRGVLLGEAIDIPAEGERLRARDKTLARRFAELSGEIERAGPIGAADEDGDWAEPTPAERRSDLARRWEELIGAIRELPDFEDFLRPPRSEDLLAAADRGPIVFVNISKYGSAAFLVQATGIEAVDLPRATPAALRAMVAELLVVACREDIVNEMDLADRRRRMSWLLGWLWDAIACPVLDRLGLVAPLGDGAAGPRLWWCPTGLLSFLPLHAAGYHDAQSGDVGRTVLDRAISSYIPTVRMLRHTRRAIAPRTGPTLVVAPGPTGLPGAAREPATIEMVTPTVLIAGQDATPEAVLPALGKYGRVHFACHAFSDLEDPSHSYLELHDGQRLSVTDVTAERLAGAEFAFLAACSTYQPGTALADEAVHLASAFQIAGYPQVIATLWPVVDTPPSRRIAERVYRDISSADGMTTVATALHLAVRAERDRAPDSPVLWAAHVHSGA